MPLLPIAVLQGAVSFLCAMLLGLVPSWELLLALLMLLPVALLYLAIGLLCGSVLNVKQVGGVCGALLTNLSAWLSGIWFDLSLVGGAFGKVANLLPFVHAVELERAVVEGTTEGIWRHLLVVLGWGIGILVGAILLFLRQMKKR